MTCARVLRAQLRSRTVCLKRCYSAPADGSIPEAKKRFVPETGSFPKGFRVGSSHAGVKPSNTTRDDITLITSEAPSQVAAVFTRNAFQAAPVRVSKAIIYGAQKVRGVVINSGCANAVTGTKGIDDAVLMSKTADDLFPPIPHREAVEPVPDVRQSSTLVMSTGVIGQPLPMDRIMPAIPKAKEASGDQYEHWLRVAKAIMTTDTFPKLVTRTFSMPSQPDTTYTLAGISKGAGMIHPNMGTLLSVVCTDCAIPRPLLRSSMQYAVDHGFNSITIDGDTSTNDTVILLANGAAAPTNPPKLTEADVAAFRAALNGIMLDLAKLVVRDGEGATKFISVNVRGDSKEVCRKVARTIATSPLVKTAMYGKDANWGRILCAIGYTDDAAIKPAAVSVSLRGPGDKLDQKLELVVNGEPCQFTDDDVKPYLDEEDVNIDVDLGQARDSKGWTYYTCDMSHEYITINADYRT